MEGKTKKILLLATISLIVIAFLSFFYDISTIKDFQAKSGGNFYKIDVIQNGTKKVYKWDIGIDKNNTKEGIVESESNIKDLEKFRDTVMGISTTKYRIFLHIIYLFYILFIFAAARKDSQIYKEDRNKKLLQVATGFLVIHFIYKASFYYIELNALYKDAHYYFMSIL